MTQKWSNVFALAPCRIFRRWNDLKACPIIRTMNFATKFALLQMFVAFNDAEYEKSVVGELLNKLGESRKEQQHFDGRSVKVTELGNLQQKTNLKLKGKSPIVVDDGNETGCAHNATEAIPPSGSTPNEQHD